VIPPHAVGCLESEATEMAGEQQQSEVESAPRSESEEEIDCGIQNLTDGWVPCEDMGAVLYLLPDLSPEFV